MDIIDNNPYRYLGVYSNSPTKERVANKGKMNAFLKVGKQVSFPLDLPNLLSPIVRNMDSVADAESKLTLPVDQIRYAQFWWMNASPLDGIAFNHLFESNIDMAVSIWEKKDNVSSLQNRIVLALVKGRIASAINLAEALYTHYSDEFAQKVAGEGFASDTPLWQMFCDTLLDNGVKSQSVVDNITISEWKAYISQKTVAPLIDSITKAIAAAKASKGKGPAARLQAGQKLMADTKDSLLQLKQLLQTTDIRYQTVADKLATEILQCGIDYYNDSEDDDCATIAMTLQKYASTVAVGSMTKQRCKENVETLQKTIDSLPPAQVMKQYREVHNELAKFCRLPDKISHVVTLLNATKAPLDAMKAVIGSTHVAYLKLSTQVVSNALHNVIEEVNDAQSTPKNSEDERLAALLMMVGLNKVLEEAWNATLLMDKFDMEADFKSNIYAENRRILKDMCEQLGISTYASSGRTTVRTQPRSTATSRTTNQSAPRTNTQRTSTSSSSNSSDNSGCIAGFVLLALGVGIGAAVGGGGGAVFGGFIALGIYGKIAD